MLYEPQEDSYLILRNIAKYTKGSVLELGTGTGILAREASKYADKVLAADIDPEALKTAKTQLNDIPNLTFLKSDLLSKIEGKFDTIIFNPPYLPNDPRAPDIALDGGKKGYEIVERFLNNVNGYLKEDGNILLLFSSLTNKNKVEEIIKKNLLEFELVDKEKFSFEELYVYRIYKSNILKKFESNGLLNVQFLRKGHRGYVYLANFKSKKVIVKVKNPNADVDKIWNDARLLGLFQKHKFVPKLYFSCEDLIVMEYIDGQEILDFLAASNKKNILTVIKKISEICRLLDKMKLNKEEMHHPVKHILVDKKLRVVFIDFERGHYTHRPKNVTQFCQFLTNKNVEELLNKKGIKLQRNKILKFAKEYKEGKNKEM